MLHYIYILLCAKPLATVDKSPTCTYYHSVDNWIATIHGIVHNGMKMTYKINKYLVLHRILATNLMATVCTPCDDMREIQAGEYMETRR